jgi:hypothetical protein
MCGEELQLSDVKPTIVLSRARQRQSIKPVLRLHMHGKYSCVRLLVLASKCTALMPPEKCRRPWFSAMKVIHNTDSSVESREIQR